MIRPTWREEFNAWFTYQVTRGGTTHAFGPLLVADTAVALMADARTVQRVAEQECNRDLTRREILRSNRAAGRIVVAVDQYLPGWRVEIGGDPRGACVKLFRPGEGGTTSTGHAVPAK